MKLSPPSVHAGIFAQTGYELFRALWADPDHPEGLVVYPDSFVPGVLLAMAELGVRPPADTEYMSTDLDRLGHLLQRKRGQENCRRVSH